MNAGDVFWMHFPCEAHEEKPLVLPLQVLLWFPKSLVFCCVVGVGIFCVEERYHLEIRFCSSWLEPGRIFKWAPQTRRALRRTQSLHLVRDDHKKRQRLARQRALRQAQHRTLFSVSQR